jgi:hypothetical protein
MPEINGDVSADTARFQAFKNRGDDLPPAWQMKASRTEIGILLGAVAAVTVLAALIGIALLS